MAISTMKHISILFTLSICIYTINANPVEVTTQNIYVLSALEHNEEIPQNAIEIQPDEIHKDIPEDHILKKKLIAMPLSDVQNNTKVLTNAQGKPILAHSTDSNEDMNTAESALVFRPLFAYRRKQTYRRRYYVPQGSYNYREQSATNQEYNPNCNCNRRQGGDFQRRRSGIRYPDWYQNAEFPALT